MVSAVPVSIRLVAAVPASSKLSMAVGFDFCMAVPVNGWWWRVGRGCRGAAMLCAIFGGDFFVA